MMSLRGVHAGTGYQYLLRSVATHDADPEGKSLSDYYAAKGTPPGRWIGSGINGLASDSVQPGAEVTEAQMAALYGDGLHPDTDDMLTAGIPLSGCKLGRSFPIYAGGKPVLEATSAAEKTFRNQEKRLPTVAEKGTLAETVGRPFYLEDGGYEHASGADVIAWVNRQRDEVKQAVSGFDFTFSPVKSVSVLWALSDEKTASRIAALHHEAVAEALAWAEDNAIYTRQGAGGIEQVKTRGMIAGEFTHFDTRGGDPDLHSHVLVSNKVQAPDGSWKALDGRTIFQLHQAISARYDTALHDRLTRRLGVEFAARYPCPDKAPVWEIRGIDHTLLETFSSRRALARPVYEQLLAGYVDKHGRQPGQRAGYALWQKAILDTRDAKKPAQSLSEHRTAWRETAVGTIGAGRVDDMLNTVQSAALAGEARPLFDAEEDLETVAEQAVRDVTSRRSTFRRSHVDTAVSTVLKGYRFASDSDLAGAHDAVMNTAMSEHAICLTPPEMLDLPGVLIGANGAGIDRAANSEKFTTAAVMDAEKITLDAAETPVAVFAGDRAINSALERHEQNHGWALNAGQEALARHLVNAGTLVAAGVGPAGTGKTAAMTVVAKAWQDTGRNVIGLAPSAAASALLAEEIGTQSHTIDSLTFTWRGLKANVPGRTLSVLPVQVSPGDLLLVDEAGMASSENLAALTEIAAESGAVVRLIGDPKQLAAARSGGLFGEVTRTPGTVQLREVMRMGADTDQAEATLGLREGNPDALDLYSEREWVRGGTREQMLTGAVQAFLADTDTGRRSLVIAASNTDVDAMNEMIRTKRITDGIVDTSRETLVARGDVVGVGDTVIARKNSKLYSGNSTYLGTVMNGQLFTVTGITDAGDLAVRDQNTGTEQLIPAGYADKSLHLGYASTIHRVQGATVDTTHAVIDTAVDRSGLYVSFTRGKHENRAYAVCETVVDPFAEDAHLHSAGDREAPTPLEVLTAVLRRNTRGKSATEELRTELEDTLSSKRTEALYRHGVDLAAAAFTAATLPDYLDALPRLHCLQVEADTEQYAALESAWTAAAKAGHDPREHWAEVTDTLGTANTPGALIASRLRAVTAAPGDLPAPPPVVPGADCELAAWLAATRAELTGGSDDEKAPARDAAQEVIAQSWTALLSEEKLSRTLQRTEARIESYQVEHDRLAERMDTVRHPGRHGQQVHREHRELDAQVEAIGLARPLAGNLHHCRQKLRQSQQQRSSAQQELGGLGRLAIRRRRELHDVLETAKITHEMYTKEATWWSTELSRIEPDPGPEHSWDHTVARAVDTRAREQELADAAQQDRHLLLATDRTPNQVKGDLERAQHMVGRLVEEVARRASLSGPQRELEHEVREDEQQRQSRQSSALFNTDPWAPSTRSTIEMLRSSYLAGREADRAAARDIDTNLDGGGSSTFSSPDTSPDIGF